MSNNLVVRVTLDQNDHHVCDPTQTFVRPGDRVTWSGPVLVFFPGDTPFVEGRGPFGNGVTLTVNTIPPIKPGTFHHETTLDGTLRPTIGDIIVQN
jgi:hypothetical protein